MERAGELTGQVADAFPDRFRPQAQAGNGETPTSRKRPFRRDLERGRGEGADIVQDQGG